MAKETRSHCRKKNKRINVSRIVSMLNLDVFPDILCERYLTGTDNLDAVMVTVWPILTWWKLETLKRLLRCSWRQFGAWSTPMKEWTYVFRRLRSYHTTAQSSVFADHIPSCLQRSFMGRNKRWGRSDLKLTQHHWINYPTSLTHLDSTPRPLFWPYWSRTLFNCRRNPW